MEKLNLGRIPTESITKMRVALKTSAPKAMSIFALIAATTIKQTSVERILKYLIMLNEVEEVQTTSGVFWRWRGNNHGN